VAEHPGPIRSGVYIANYGPFGDVPRLCALCELAERSGWHGFFIWDQVYSGVEPTVDPWVVLAACAARTGRIKLGAMVTPVARRRPIKLARELLSLDQLSDGRVIGGVGLGDAAGFRQVGEPSSAQVRVRRFEHGTRLLDRLLHETNVTSPADGLNEPLTLGPHPTGARIPLWLGMAHDRPQGPRRAATLPVNGIIPIRRPWNVRGLLSADELGALVRTVAESGATLDDVATIGRSRSLECEPLADYVEAGMTWWLELLHHELDSDRDVERRIAAGPPPW
jgi:hypothetical protein